MGMAVSEEGCPVCGEGYLIEHINNNLVEHKGVQRLIKIKYSVCLSCGGEQADRAQLQFNKQEMMKFKNSVDECTKEIQKDP